MRYLILGPGLKLIAMPVIAVAAFSFASAQERTAPAQQIRLQFKDSGTYKDARDVEVKTAVMMRRLSIDSRNRRASIRILLSNLESDLCAKDEASIADVASPIALTGDSDFVLTFAAVALQSMKKDIADVDLYRLFFVPEAPPRVMWLAHDGATIDRLFPNQRLILTNPDRPGAQTDVIPRGMENEPPTYVFVEKMTSSWILYHSAVKKPPYFMTTSRGHAIVSREQDGARINFRFEGGQLTTKVASEGNLALRVCPSIVMAIPPK